MKYIKLFVKNSAILLIIISAIVSNTYLLYLNSRYDNFYKNIPNNIDTKAVVVR